MRIRPILIILAIAVLLLAACNQSGLGIFYSIAIEEELGNASLGDDLVISSFIATEERYYALAGSLWTRGSDDSDWRRIEPPAGRSIIASMARTANGLYAVAADIDGVASSLFRIDETSDLPSFAASPIDVDGDENTADRVASIVSTGTDLFVNVRAPAADSSTITVYDVYRSSDGVGFSLVLEELLVAVKHAVVFDGATFLVSANRLYSDSTGSFTPVTAAGSPGSADPAETSLADATHAVSLGALLVIAEDGTLYAYDGSVWLDPAELFGDAEAVEASVATKLLEVTLEAPDILLLVGTDRGYYEAHFVAPIDQTTLDSSVLALPGVKTPTTSTAQFSILANRLATSTVLDLDEVYLDAGDDLLLISTAGAGLWRIEYAAVNKVWSLE